MMRRPLVLAVLFAAVSSSACLVGGACSTQLVFSVSIEVVDTGGTPVRDAVVTFTVDGGATQPATCDLPVEGGGCTRWHAGEERAGQFVVRAQRGNLAATASTVVADGECHVQARSVRLVVR
jgi:hypothetical protein